MQIQTYQGEHKIEYSVVKLSELEGALRIDAEYYDPVYLRNEKLIEKNKWKYLGNIFEYVYSGKTPTSYEGGGNYKVVRSGDLTGNIINKDILLKTTEKNLFWIEKGDILISSIGKGSIGKVAINLENERLSTVSEVNVLRQCNENPFYLAIYLQEKIGQKEINRQITGATGQLHLLPSKVKLIEIPIPSQNFQKQIEKLVLDAYKERENADKLYKEAENILLKELELKNWKPKTKKIKVEGKEFEEEENISIRGLSECLKVNRFDAEYWDPKYDEIEDLIKDYRGGYMFVNDVLTDSIKNGTTPKNLIKSFEKDKYPFVRIDTFGPFLDIKEEALYSIEKNILKKLDYCNIITSDVLVSMTGTIGESAIYTLKKQGVINQNIMRLRPNKKIINSESLALYIKVVGKIFLQKLQTGNVQPYVNILNFSKLLIPVIDPQIQQRIFKLIQGSFEARENSKKLLEIAKKSVEIYIERDEKEGLNHVKEKLHEIEVNEATKTHNKKSG